jgi:hypothetical protein
LRGGRRGGGEARGQQRALDDGAAGHGVPPDPWNLA